MIEDKLISWAQYLHWADLNIDRYLNLGECDDSVKIAIVFQWLASEYVVIEGWLSLGLSTHAITEFIRDSEDTVNLLRRVRNAVYHYQKEPLDERLMAFTSDSSRIVWVAELHRRFLIFLNRYPNTIIPRAQNIEEFTTEFYRLVGWVPSVKKTHNHFIQPT